MNDKELTKIITEFVDGLLKKAKCDHAGNCYMMCQILKPYLFGLYGIDTLIQNTTVKQNKLKINHYYLLRIKDGLIIDATSSQFNKPDGSKMPKVFIGKKPKFYLI